MNNNNFFHKKDNFKVYSWGYNKYGQLGLGHNKNEIIPININELNNEKIKRIFVGDYHNFCLNGNFIYFIFIIKIDNGNLYCWGSNYCGQLGIGNNLHQNKPQRYLEKQNFLFISGGLNHTLALTSKLILFLFIIKF